MHVGQNCASSEGQRYNLCQSEYPVGGPIFVSPIFTNVDFSVGAVGEVVQLGWVPFRPGTSHFGPAGANLFDPAPFHAALAMGCRFTLPNPLILPLLKSYGQPHH